MKTYIAPTVFTLGLLTLTDPSFADLKCPLLDPANIKQKTSGNIKINTEENYNGKTIYWHQLGSLNLGNSEPIKSITPLHESPNAELECEYTVTTENPTREIRISLSPHSMIGAKVRSIIDVHKAQEIIEHLKNNEPVVIENGNLKWTVVGLPQQKFEGEVVNVVDPLGSGKVIFAGVPTTSMSTLFEIRFKDGHKAIFVAHVPGTLENLNHLLE